MKALFFVILVHCTLSLAFANNTTIATYSSQNAEAQKMHAAEGVTLACSTSTNDVESLSIMSRAEADSMRVQEANFLSETDIGDAKVGAVGSNELIFILIVVLLVVVIIKVI